MNNFFITVNLAVMAAVSFVWDIKFMLILAAGIVVSFYGCFLFGTISCSIVVKNAASNVVNWNTSSIVSAIRGYGATI